eukprot:INCI11285.1.p1 GENE.INCI11285.1~~INCI11285.1.p1  ORF type:complete len:290 (+),score=41.23 INCI11285.1:179-1048(+)
MSVFLDYGGVNATTPSQEQDFIIGFTDEELQALTITTGVSAALSLIGSGMILGTYIGLPGTRSFAFQMVFMLSLCDFMSSLAFVFSLGVDYTSDVVEDRCYAAAYMNQFFGNGANFWTAIMAFNVYYSLVTKKITRGFLPFYHVTAWVLSLILTAVPGAFNAYGYSGTWCWIQDENGSLYHLYFFDIPLFVCLLFVVVCYSGSIVVMRQAAGAAGNRLEKQIVVKLMLRVVLVFFKSRLWGVVNRVQHYVNPTHPILALYLLQYIFGPLQGLGNAVVYGLNKTVKDECV